MTTKLGEYERIYVTPERLRWLLSELSDAAQADPTRAAFVQFAPSDGGDVCADGVELFFRAEPRFSLTVRLNWVLRQAADIQRIASGYAIEHRGDTPQAAHWLVTFQSPDDPIAEILFQVLREICGCGVGQQTYVYWPDPDQWRDGDGNPASSALTDPLSSG